jgi:hypothetical protein
VGLPGSKSVAREEETVWNLGGPESSRRTNYERQAGRVDQRQEGHLKANRESDRFIVVRGNPACTGPNWPKGATRGHRSTGNPIRMNDGVNWANLPGASDQRVLVKSPVRENRPPGSVRGARGNPRPYLDNRHDGGRIGKICRFCLACAGFRTCRAAGIQTCSPRESGADLEATHARPTVASG